MLEPSDYSEAFAERLRSLGVEAALIGALAALRYRHRPRYTIDVDFLARTLDGIAASVEADGFETKVLAEPDEPPYAIFIRGDGRRIDVLRAETSFQHAALDRAVGGVITVEDVIVHKLIAWRPRDRDDVDSILAAGHELDVAYIEGWAREWEVLDRWEQARRRG